MNTEDILTSFVKERGIAKIIEEMKLQMEYNDYIIRLGGNWEMISKQYLSIPFVRLYKEKLNWNLVQTNINLSDKEIIEFQDYIKFGNFCPRLCNTIEIIELFEDKINWDYVFSRLDNLSDDMIRRFGHRFLPLFRIHFIYGIPINYVDRVRELLK